MNFLCIMSNIAGISCSYIAARVSGFIPDIVRILEKYDLLEYLESYRISANFPYKGIWKNLVKTHTTSFENTEWKRRLTLDQSLHRF